MSVSEFVLGSLGFQKFPRHSQVVRGFFNDPGGGNRFGISLILGGDSDRPWHRFSYALHATGVVVKSRRGA